MALELVSEHINLYIIITPNLMTTHSNLYIIMALELVSAHTNHDTITAPDVPDSGVTMTKITLSWKCTLVWLTEE